MPLVTWRAGATGAGLCRPDGDLNHLEPPRTTSGVPPSRSWKPPRGLWEPPLFLRNHLGNHLGNHLKIGGSPVVIAGWVGRAGGWGRVVPPTVSLRPPRAAQHPAGCACNGFVATKERRCRPSTRAGCAQHVALPPRRLLGTQLHISGRAGSCGTRGCCEGR